MMGGDELNDLLLDAWNLLDAYQSVGVEGEAPDAPTPEIIWPEGTGAMEVAVAVEVPKEAVQHAEAWSAVAQQYRDAPEEPVAPQDPGPEAGDALRACTDCSLCHTRKQVVVGEGQGQGGLFVVGPPPSVQEDSTGRPLEGAPGALLDRMLQGVLGLTRDKVFLTPAVKCRVPDGERLMKRHADACRPHLMAQVRQRSPRVVLLLGEVALRQFTGRSGVADHRGQWIDHQGVAVRVTYDPATLASDGRLRRPVFDDLKAVAARLSDAS